MWVLNVWAHGALLVALNIRSLRLIKRQSANCGVNYKDDAAAAARWLIRWGNPYRFSLSDKDGAAGLDWGVYGVPETFVIDGDGVVHYKQVGPMDETVIKKTICRFCGD